MPLGLYTGPNVSTGNGVTTVFPYTFKINAQADLKVKVAGVEVTTGFTVSGVGSASGGNVTFAVAPADGDEVFRGRNKAYRRDTDYQRNGSFDEETVDADFDGIEMQVQQLAAANTRSVKAPESVSTDLVVTDDDWEARADTVFGFDALGALRLLAIEVGTSLVDLAASAGASLIGFIQAGVGAVLRHVEAKLRATVSIEDFGGGPGETATVNSAALAAAITKLGANGGTIVLEAPEQYELNAQCNLPRDVNLVGQHTPGANPTDAPTGTRIKRVADVILFNLVGPDRASDRVGRNRFTGIQFVDDANISTKAWFNCKYADSLIFEHCSFWQPDGQVTAGHVFDIEECWDWRFWNCIWKHYGNVAQTKHALNINNGAIDNTNGFRFYGCRWQEGMGSALNFAATGGGSNNHDFELHGCKMEDTGNGSKTHIADAGTISDLKIFGGEYAGCGERQISQAAGSTRWRIFGATFANGGAAATEMIELLGNRSSVVGCTFQGPGAGITRYINTTGADCEVTGCSRASTVLPLVNAAGVNATTKIHHNPDFITEYSSTAQITAALTSVVVNHNAGYTPAQHHIMVSPHSDWGTATKWWVSGIGATQFTINVDAAPGATITFVWWLDRKRG